MYIDLKEELPRILQLKTTCIIPLSAPNNLHEIWQFLNILNAELNPICHLLELLGAHPIFYISRIRVNFRPGLYVLIQKALVLNTFRRVRKILAEQRINAWPVRPENRTLFVNCRIQRRFLQDRLGGCQDILGRRRVKIMKHSLGQCFWWVWEWKWFYSEVFSEKVAESRKNRVSSRTVNYVLAELRSSMELYYAT